MTADVRDRLRRLWREVRAAEAAARDARHRLGVAEGNVHKAAAALRQFLTAAEAESSPSRWSEADAYAELSRRKWSQRKIAEECGTNDTTVLYFIRCAKRFRTEAERSSFWAAYQQVRPDATAHIAQRTGEQEWYTPAEYIAAARRALGDIDLDPATSAIAQRTVKARHYFTRDEDGLVRPWRGRVWLNPPYADPLIGRFVHKRLAHYRGGDVSAARQARVAGWKDQRLARLFLASGRSQQALADRLGRAQQGVAQHLRFGRFLAFFTTSGSKEGFKLPPNLTERGFRTLWEGTEAEGTFHGHKANTEAAADDERRRFGAVFEALREIGLRRASKPVKQAILAVARPGEWLTLEDLRRRVEGRLGGEVKLVDIDNCLRLHLHPTPKAPFRVEQAGEGP
jgi:hypothetical protein